MTVLLVLFTIIIFLTADYFVQRARRATADERLWSQLSPGADFPSDVRLARNHTWIKIDGQGNVILGLDSFLSKLLGSIEEVVLPAAGTLVAPSARAIAVRQGKKRLEIAAPIPGRVIAVNANARNHPDVMKGDPFGEGWLVKIHPSDAYLEGHLTMGGEKARQWLGRQGELVKEFFLPRVPAARFATMQDGGTPSDGLLQQFDADVWREFQESFVSLDDRVKGIQSRATEVRS